MSTELSPLPSQSVWCTSASPLTVPDGIENDFRQEPDVSDCLHRETFDVVVVGGGLAGLSAAYHLLRAQPGLRVVVLEAQTIGYGASTRSSGMLTPGIGQNLAALVKKYGAEQARMMYRTSLAAVEYLAELSHREQMDFGLRWTGQLIVARGHAGRQRLARQAALMGQLNLPCRELDDVGLAGRVSISLDAPGKGPAALQLSVAGVLDPTRLVRGLAAAVLRLGGRIVENTKVEHVSSSGVDLAGGLAIRAKKVVLATNAYDLSLGMQRGRLIPMHLRMIATRPLTESERSALAWHQREGVIDSRRVFNYFRLTDDHRLILGGGVPRYRWQGGVQDLASTGPDVASLTADLRQLFPQLSGVEIERTWTGVIAYSIDTLPVIGSPTRFPNVLHVGGWCGHGIALSVYAGRWVSDLIVGTSDAPQGLRSDHSAAELAQPWFRNQAPRVPTEIARWCGIKLGAWSTQMIDRFV
ncbi:NAD(P)/FAD-dependent oxidoreductase [Aporhodopirellula aestuarii]|uniref:FAD-binding oxidoreductase n=1 Tax=Aporhodopirellula aestuarii TaxID=2950107 RepID=A0ABT0U3V3_9BACT|nr:FAD-dependent oxidoreductase [Aporhodopirellula aestuarii]MCM2371550.1 FAD-binding oxidoreductase [Aporhodopirellula aestuarii]